MHPSSTRELDSWAADRPADFLVWGLCARGRVVCKWKWIPARAGAGAASTAMAACMWRKAGALGLTKPHRRVAADPERVRRAGRAGRGPAFGLGVRGKNRPPRSPSLRGML